MMDKQTVDEIRAWLAESDAIDATPYGGIATPSARAALEARCRQWENVLVKYGEDWLRQLLAEHDDNEAQQADSGG